MYFRLKAKLTYLMILQAILKFLVVPIIKIIGTTIKTVLTLPHIIVIAAFELYDSISDSLEVRRQLKNWSNDQLIEQMYEDMFGKDKK